MQNEDIHTEAVARIQRMAWHLVLRRIDKLISPITQVIPDSQVAVGGRLCSRMRTVSTIDESPFENRTMVPTGGVVLTAYSTFSVPWGGSPPLATRRLRPGWDEKKVETALLRLYETVYKRVQIQQQVGSLMKEIHTLLDGVDSETIERVTVEGEEAGHTSIWDEMTVEDATYYRDEFKALKLAEVGS